ncbi:MAG: hypothetical protein Q9217_002592 [Psora testacea]
MTPELRSTQTPNHLKDSRLGRQLICTFYRPQYNRRRLLPPIRLATDHCPLTVNFDPTAKVHEVKATRRAEIERRCAALNPPMLSNVLVHMGSFRAAIHKSQPLTDATWEERVQHASTSKKSLSNFGTADTIWKDRGAFDRERRGLQLTLRDKVVLLADEVIKTRWSNG